jgi:hypothetical protein
VSEGTVEITVVVTVTVAPVSLIFPTIALYAIVGAVAAAIIAVGVAGMAVFAWSRCLRQAAVERDFGWIRDLILVPFLAAWATVACSAAVARWEETFPHSNVIEHLKTVIPQSGPIVIVPLIVAIQDGVAAGGSQALVVNNWVSTS